MIEFSEYSLMKMEHPKSWQVITESRQSFVVTVDDFSDVQWKQT